MRPLAHALAAAALVAAAAPALQAQAADPAAATGVRRELIRELDDAERKLVALANAMPQDKMGWRPDSGVRSMSEVLVHVAGANLMIPRMAGVTRDPGVEMPQDAERTITDRARIAELLQQSFAHAKQALMDLPEAEMDAAVQLFGQPSTKRGVFVLMATHAQNHLGQAIAYARMNGIAPPWSGS